MGNWEKVDVLVLGQLVGVLANGVIVAGLEGVRDVDYSTADPVSLGILEGVFEGFGDFYFGKSVFLLLGLAG